ncbi:MAG: 2-oxoacid:acceptor oxidoreductase family protein [Bdellovibrio sp.]|nr:2-oxoacid:acceptor oxidoreductase family protein [Bdellovibrio sp.]
MEELTNESNLEEAEQQIPLPSHFPYPGVPVTMDGSQAVVAVETKIASGAAAYPITPATNMGVGFQQAVADGVKNVWGETLVFVEPESEHSAASACEGFALTGGRVSNFTAGQGLILMKEVLYTICGKRLPMVFQIGARALTHHALNVHAGHDDVMGVADTGWGMLFARSVQEVSDFSLIARKTSEESFTPFFNIQDGFLTTHTVETLCSPEVDLIKIYLKAPHETLTNFMDPKRPVMSGTVQNQDAYMKGKVAQRKYYENIAGILKQNFLKFYELTGRKYGLVDSYRLEDADLAFVGMGSFMETAMAAVDWLRQKQKLKIGVLSVLSYRPFPALEVVHALKNVHVISVLERLDDSMSLENPLARDIKAAFCNALAGELHYPRLTGIPIIQHGSGGLGGRDVRVSDFLAIVDNMKKGIYGKTRYCVGIKHEDALYYDKNEPDVRPEGSFSVRGHSIGGYGSITTNKIIASVCGDLFGLKVQAFPKYGAEKKGLPTSYFLTIAHDTLRFHQELNRVEAVVINDLNAFLQPEILRGLRSGGTLMIQLEKNDFQTLRKKIPAPIGKEIIERRIKCFALDAEGIAKQMGSDPDLIQRMQGIVLLGVFLKVTPIASRKGMNYEELMSGVERIIRKYFGKRGEKVVSDNLTAIKRGYKEVLEVPRNILGEK